MSIKGYKPCCLESQILYFDPAKVQGNAELTVCQIIKQQQIPVILFPITVLLTSIFDIICIWQNLGLDITDHLLKQAVAFQLNKK